MKQSELSAHSTLSQKVVRGGAWILGLRIYNRGLGFIRTIILARLLAPEDFGLLGIAMLAISTIETFSQTGFETVVIQKKGDVELYLDTAWTVSVIRGALLFVILFISAPFVAHFFNTSQATLIIRVIAISTLISGFRNIGIVFFQKELEFNKQFFYEFISAFVDLIVAVILAFILRDVWALIWAGLAGNVVRLVMSYIIHPYRPNIRLNKYEIKVLFSFGKWLLGSSIVTFLVTQGDDILVGKILGITALGMYQMAYLISNLPTTEITHVIAQATFPAYSKMQDDLPKLRIAFLDIFQLTAFISIPLSLGILILAPEFTQIFLGEKWLPMVPVLQILVLAGLIRSIAATLGPFFVGIGRPDIDTKGQIIRLIGLMITIYPLTLYWGLIGASISVLFSISVFVFVFSFMFIKISGCRLKDFFKMILVPIIFSLFMITMIIIFKKLFNLHGILEFVFLVAIGITCYILAMFLLDNILNYRIMRLIQSKLNIL